MAIQKITGGVCAAQGFTASGIHCGIRKNKDKRDLCLVYSEAPCTVGCTYTQNKVQGAPIAVTKQHVKDGHARAILCNSGNANTCNADGVEVAQAMCTLAADALGLAPEDIIVASTGVIGQRLPIQPIRQGIAPLAAQLSRTGNDAATEAIMTTDTFQKQSAYSFVVDGKTCHIGGMAKGSGMIHPNMATMLAFVTTDCAISHQYLQKMVSDVVQDTFNMVSVDGDTSTNDMLCVLANGRAGNDIIDTENAGYAALRAALFATLRDLSMAIAKDGEGATKLLECNVTGAQDQATAVSVSKSVITSSLLKAAMFGEDANWGRILCAIGYAEGSFEIDRVSVSLRSVYGSILVCQNGSGVDFSEEEAAKILSADTIDIDISLGEGACRATAWGCDLSYDYVKINGDYRT